VKNLGEIVFGLIIIALVFFFMASTALWVDMFLEEKKCQKINNVYDCHREFVASTPTEGQ